MRARAGLLVELLASCTGGKPSDVGSGDTGDGSGDSGDG